MKWFQYCKAFISIFSTDISQWKYADSTSYIIFCPPAINCAFFLSLSLEYFLKYHGTSRTCRHQFVSSCLCQCLCVLGRRTSIVVLEKPPASVLCLFFCIWYSLVHDHASYRVFYSAYHSQRWPQRRCRFMESPFFGRAGLMSLSLFGMPRIRHG